MNKVNVTVYRDISFRGFQTLLLTLSALSTIFQQLFENIHEVSKSRSFDMICVETFLFAISVLAT
jgi:hypothetical protein